MSINYKNILEPIIEDIEGVAYRLLHFVCRALEDWNAGQKVKLRLYVDNIPPINYNELHKCITLETREAFSDLCYISKNTFDNILKDPLYSVKNMINILKICHLNNYDFSKEISFILYGKKYGLEKKKSNSITEILLQDINNQVGEISRIEFVTLMRGFLKKNEFDSLIKIIAFLAKYNILSDEKKMLSLFEIVKK